MGTWGLEGDLPSQAGLIEEPDVLCRCEAVKGTALSTEGCKEGARRERKREKDRKRSKEAVRHRSRPPPGLGAWMEDSVDRPRTGQLPCQAPTCDDIFNGPITVTLIDEWLFLLLPF